MAEGGGVGALFTGSACRCWLPKPPLPVQLSVGNRWPRLPRSGESLMPSDLAIRRAELGDLDPLSLLVVALDDHHIKLRPDLFKQLLHPARAHHVLRFQN
jgi:hypothetical protein